MADFNTYWATRRARPGTCLGDVSELDSRKLSSFDAVMPQDYFVRKLPRKWWEWEYIAECAETLDLLNSSTTALGLGAGFEPLIFHFANSCKAVIATDLYSSDTAWSEARFATTKQVIESAPIRFPTDRVEVRNADMRQTGAADASVDFVWSCSSIERIPTLKDLFLVFAEIDRILKVGGHAILTTEFTVTGNPYLLPGVNAWNDELFEAIKPALRGFEFVGPTDLSFNALHPGNAARPRRYLPASSLPGSSPQLSYYHRAGTLANPVGLSIIVPIAFVLRKTSNAGVAAWNEIAISPLVRMYADGLDAFFADRLPEAIELLGNVYRSQDCDLQMKHLAFRFMIDAKAKSGQMAQPETFADAIEEFTTQVPSGPVQDADCLDLCAYLLGECGRVAQSLRLYEKCIKSPSTSREHLFELLGSYLVLADKHGAKSHSDELAASIISDLVQFGLSGVELMQMSKAPISEKIGKPRTADIKKQARKRLEVAIKSMTI